MLQFTSLAVCRTDAAIIRLRSSASKGSLRANQEVKREQWYPDAPNSHCLGPSARTFRTDYVKKRLRTGGPDIKDFCA